MLTSSEFWDVPSETQALFPKHGWCMSTHGLRLLRLPILRVFGFYHPARQRYDFLGLGGVWLQTRSPYRAIKQLGIALRELHAELRVILDIADENWMDREVSPARNDAFNRQAESTERCEVLLISVFMLLRRLPDDLIDVLRPAMFEFWKSAPSSLKKAVEFAETGELHKLKPFCDADKLSAAILENSTWLNRLRLKDGVRDTLVHRPHALRIQGQGSKPETADQFKWTFEAFLMVGNSDDNVEYRPLFPVLLECIAGACNLMTALARLIGGMDSYDRSDWLILTGEDNDSVGFWPSIDGQVHQFPLRE